MKSHVRAVLALMMLVALPLLLASGCVTIEYVDQKVSTLEGMIAENSSRIDNVDAKTVANSAAIMELRNQSVVDQVVMEEEVLFEVGNWTLSDTAKEILDTLASDIARSDSNRILVVGHADNVGSAKSNYLLGLLRAHSVASYLVGEAGLDSGKIIVNSYGEQIPVLANETSEGRAKNRRVEIIVYRSLLSGT